MKKLLFALLLALTGCVPQMTPLASLAVHVENPNWVMNDPQMPIPVTGGRTVFSTPVSDDFIETTPTVALPVVPEGCQPGYDFSFEVRVLELVNVERSNYGLPPLTLAETLAATARDHTADMACNHYVSHTGLDGSTPGDRMAAHGYDWLYFGENIAAGPGYDTPDKVVKAWMGSPGHRANILNPNFTEIGVGYAFSEKSSYDNYWTLDFGQQK